ncbi:MAG: hypothetical protein NC305_10925, partial [Lachnospiraceae bacterium]|nr:hypothetical protein [Lachnospiraceae bacterium]
FSILFTVMAFATTGKKSRLQVHNYPPEIQEEYFRTHERMEVQPLSSRVFDPRGIRYVITSIKLSREWRNTPINQGFSPLFCCIMSKISPFG